MEPRLYKNRETTPPPRMRFEEAPNMEGDRIERKIEGDGPLELRARENGSQGMSLCPLLAAHLGRYENGQALQSSLTSVYGGHQSSINISRNLPPNGAIHMQKWVMPVTCHMFTYTRKDSARIWWNNEKSAVIMSLTDINASLTEHNLHQQCKLFSKGNSSTQQWEHFFTGSGKITLAMGTILHYQWQNNSSIGNSAVRMIFTNSGKILH
nr:reverse transcriptase domain-containing protein [Tanacetum cinerariifolium]